MALITPGPLTGLISGKVGGVVFTHGDSYDAVRINSKQIKSRTPLISLRQSYINKCLALWRGLTDGQQAVWETAGLRFPKTSRVGETYYLSGYSLCLACNLKLLSYGRATITDGDLDDLLDVESYEELLGEPNSLVAEFSSTTIPAGYNIGFWAAPPGSSGRHKSHPGYYKLVKVISSLAEVEHDFFADYIAVYGMSALRVGSSVYSYVEYVDVDSGLSTSKQFQSCIVTA